MNDKLIFFSTLTDDATFSCMVGSSRDIVEHKRARPSSLYSESYYIAESDFFSFHTIQMQKMSYLKVEPQYMQRHNTRSITPQQIAFFNAEEWCNGSLLGQVQQVSLNTSKPDLFHCILHCIRMRLRVITCDF